MQEGSDKSKIDNLREALYSRKIKIKPNFVLDLNSHSNEVKDNWEKEKTNLSSGNEFVSREEPSRDFSKKILWLAFVFFLISICVAGYVYFKGTNLIGSNNIQIDVVGPTTVRAGEETVLDVSVTNNNDIALEVVDLVLEYPAGTRSAMDSATPMTHDRVAFDDIAPHTTVRRTIKAIFYGEESKMAHIDMTLEYRIATAMSVFTKDSSYEVLIGSSPLTLSVEGLREVNANQDYNVTINVVSNSDEIVKDVILTSELPYGYDVISATPAPEPKTTVWNLGDIESKGKRTMVLKGKMYGDHNEERYFKISVGTRDTKILNQISGVISAVMHQVTIREPFIGVNLVFNKGDSVDTNYVAKSGAIITANVDLVNNLDVPIYDVSLESKITGSIVTPNSQKTGNGFYDSNTNIIRWNKSYEKDFETVLPDNSLGTVYTFNTLRSSLANTSKIINPTFITDITVRAKRRLESGVPEDIISTIHKVVRVQTEAYFSAQITHNTGPIENEGTLPPKVGQKTDYTVTWAVTNTFNEINGAKVTATLPDYVAWNNVVVGAGENISYNPDSREISWNLGTVRTQSGGKAALRQVSFQIGFTPSQSQIQSAPPLVNVANFSARDTFTDTVISGESEILTTALPTDPLYTYDDSQVAE